MADWIPDNRYGSDACDGHSYYRVRKEDDVWSKFKLLPREGRSIEDYIKGPLRFQVTYGGRNFMKKYRLSQEPNKALNEWFGDDLLTLVRRVDQSSFSTSDSVESVQERCVSLIENYVPPRLRRLLHHRRNHHVEHSERNVRRCRSPDVHIS